MTTPTQPVAAPAPVDAIASPPPQQPPGGGPVRAVRRHWTEHGLVFVAPFLAFYALFLIWPLLYGVLTSLTNRDIAGTRSDYIGFDNYIEALNDPAVWDSLWNTIWFTVLSTVPLVFLGLVLALLAHHLRFVSWLWRLSWFAPFLLPSGVVCLLWLWVIYPADFGFADQLLTRLGMDPGIGWLTDTRYAMVSVVLTTVWWTVGFNFLLYLAALQAIPQQLYEAAELDGASPWQRLRTITLPMLSRTTGLILVLQILNSLKIFDQIYILTSGGPDESTRPILQYVYESGFTGYRIGYASAVSYIFFVLIVVVSLVHLRFTRRAQKENAS